MIISMGRNRNRTTAVAVAAALSMVATLIVVTAGNAAAAVEDEGADCPVPGSVSLTSNSLLPDPFRRLDGTRITTTADWRCRRAEIKELSERYIYGQKPARPSSVTGTVSNTSITVNVSDQGRSASFSASVSLPSGTGPFPAVIVVGSLGADTTTIRNAGVAIINYDPYAVGREGTPRSNKQGAFYTLYGSSSSTGLLVAWSWGVSRIIDVIEQSGGSILTGSAVGVTGCSRFGKGAFVAGAFDQRIALTMPIESGAAGVPILRGIPGESGAQPLSSAYSEQPWLGDSFSSFTSNPNTLPVDTHSVIGMIAPRGLFIMENPAVDWLATRSGSVAALAGAEIYKALGAGNNISYWSAVQNGTHCAVRTEWRTTLQQYVQRFLRNSGSTTSTFQIASNKAGNLAQWRDWTTPNLSGGPTTTTTTTTTGTVPGTPGTPGTSNVTSSSVTLSWGASSGTVSSYLIERATGASSTSFAQVGTSTSTSFTDSGLAANTTYRYRVRATNSAGSSSYSAITNVTTPSGQTGGSCTYRIDSWDVGYVAHVTVNGPRSGWSIPFTLGANNTISNSWNATISGTGTSRTASNVSHNGNLAAGQSTSWGFQASRPAGGALPTFTGCTAQ